MIASIGSMTKGEMVDTNILIYAIDANAGDKHDRADQLMQRLIDEGSLTLSVQVLNEFFVVATRKAKPPLLSHEKATQAIRELIQAAQIVPLTPTVTLMALDAMPKHGFSFWDALVWAAAKAASMSVLYIEDFQHGRDVEGVRIVNPFLTDSA